MLHRSSPLVLCALLAAMAGGCKKAAPPAPAPQEAAAPAETPTSLLNAALDEAGVALPVTPGAGAAEPPLALVEEEVRWTSPTVVVGHHSVLVDGQYVMRLDCLEGPASCKAPSGSSKQAWSPLTDAVGASGGPVTTIALHRALPYEVMAGVIGAATASGQPARLLVRTRGEALGAVPVEGSPALRQKRIEGLALARFVDTQALGKQVTAALPGDAKPDPARAPGQLVRVTTGPLEITEACGGAAAATALRRGIRGYRSCYREALLRSQKTSGKVAIALQLGAEGRVTDAKMAEDTTGDSQLAACLQAEAAKVQLPPHTSKEACTTTLRLELRTEAEAQAAPSLEVARRLTAPTPANAPLTVVAGATSIELRLGATPTVTVSPADRAALVTALRKAGSGAREVELSAAGETTAERVVEVARAALEAGANHVVLTAPR